MGDTLRTLTAEADLVIIDAPPLLPVADAQILIARPEIDAVLVVGRAYFTKREQVRRSRAIIEQQGAQPLGLAVTGLRDYNIYGYYGEADGKKRAPAAAPVGTIQP
jgi:receptor protein-tyrosine kinase